MDKNKPRPRLIKTKPSKKTVKKEGAALVPLKFVIPNTIITRFATNMTVQVLEQEFKINFYEMKPELCFEQNAKPPSDIQADCVASVVLTAERVVRLIKALQDQLDRQHEVKN